MTSMLKSLCAVLFAVVLAAGSAQATQYTVLFTPPFGASPEVGEFVHVFTNYGFCSGCSQQCQACLTPGAWQWGLDGESGNCAWGEQWNDFAVGFSCYAPPCANDCWYEIVDHPSATCWVLEECPTE